MPKTILKTNNITAWAVVKSKQPMIVHKIKWWQSTADKQFYFHTTSRNGKVVQPSEAYPKKATMLKTVQRIVAQYSVPVPVVEVPDPQVKVKKVAPKKGSWGVDPILRSKRSR